MSLAAFIASQRADHGVPHAVACRAVDVSESWFYKGRDREPTDRQRRRAELDAKVGEIFEDSGGNQGTYGSPRIHAELRDLGWQVSEKTVAASMARQGLVARPKRRFRCLTRPDKRAVPFPDLLRRDFSATAPNVKWCGDMTEIPTGEGKLSWPTSRICSPGASSASPSVSMPTPNWPRRPSRPPSPSAAARWPA